MDSGFSAKRWVLIITLSALASSCGLSAGSDESKKTVSAIEIVGSSYSGMAFSANDVTNPGLSSRVFYYNFSTGLVHERLTSESGDAALFYVKKKLFVFNRHVDSQNYLWFDPKSDGEIEGSAPITGISAGDPWDVMDLSSNSLLLAAPASGDLYTLDLDQATVSKTLSVEWNTDGNSFNPVSFNEYNDEVYVLHQETNGGRAHIFALDNSSSLKPTDLDQSTIEIDGIAITSSAPFGFIGETSAPLIIGLCSSAIASCKSGADQLNTGDIPTFQNLNTFDQLQFEQFHQIIEGEDSDTIYAHVYSKSDSKYVIIKMNVQTKVVELIHSFAGVSRLYGILYDKSSGVLFVGDMENGSGTMVLYKNDEKLASFQLDGVPYKGVLIP